MYTEETRRRIDWGEIIRKGLLIVLIVAIILLVIWLFSRKNLDTGYLNYNKNNSTKIQQNSNNKSNNNNSNINESNSTSNTNDVQLDSNVYSESFINNYTYYHLTSRDYFVTNEVPTVGKTIRYSIQDLIDKGILLKAKYGNGYCDLDTSYVSITNSNNAYSMVTVLACGNEIVKTTERLSCSLLCNSTCVDDEDYGTDTIVEYEYKKAYTETVTTYSCPDGYTKSGSGKNTKCYKNGTSTVPVTVTTTYSCPSGYNKIGSGANTKCVSSATSTIAATKTVNYSCPAGYIQSGSGANTKCYKTSSSYVPAHYNYTYKCPSGYELNGTKCVKTQTTSATPHTSYTCPDGYDLNGTKCVKTVNASYKYHYHCPDGYEQHGTGANMTCTITRNATKHYYCPSGYDSHGSGASMTCTKSYNATPKYKCTEGELVNTNQCRTYSTSTVYKYWKTKKSDGNVYEYDSGNSHYVCKYLGPVVDPCTTSSNCVGLYYKYKCTVKTAHYKPATIVGYKPCTKEGYTLQGSKCVKTIGPKHNYKCPDGYDLNGTKCIKSKSPIKEKKYYCETGTLSGTKCIIKINATLSTTYSCPSGYNISGTKCYKTITINAEKQIHYYCDHGYILQGNKCYKQTNEYIKPNEYIVYSCPEGYTLNGKVCYKNTSSIIDPIINTSYTCPSGYNKIGDGESAVCSKGSTSTTKPIKSTKKVTKYKYKWSTEESLSGWTRTGKTRKKTASYK